MLNFNFQNPTHIYFGEGQIKAISKEVPINARSGKDVNEVYVN